MSHEQKTGEKAEAARADEVAGSDSRRGTGRVAIGTPASLPFEWGEQHAQNLAQMRAWLEDTAPLEQLRRRMPPGSTLEDARRLHRLLAQQGRRFSKVMRDLTEELA